MPSPATSERRETCRRDREIKMTSALAEVHTELELRSPRELAPLIKEQVQLGDLASKEAGMPYYRKAGGLMEEARAGVKIEGKQTFTEYCEDVSGKSYSTCQSWIRAYNEQVAQIEDARKKRKRGSTLPLSNSLREMKGTSQAGKYRPFREYQKEVDKAAETARKQQLKAADDRATEQKRKQELARKLIDIGFRVLAKELHPDKMGGNKDAMSRLNEVRKRLMAVYG